MHGQKCKDPSQAAVPGDSFTTFKVHAWSLKMEPIGCFETSVTNYNQRSITSQKIKNLIYTAAYF
jgi:hypothetical protein